MADHEPMNLAFNEGSKRHSYSLDVRVKLAKRASALKAEWEREMQPELRIALFAWFVDIRSALKGRLSMKLFRAK